MVFLDNGSTVNRRVQACLIACPSIRTLLNRGASLSFQILTIGYDDKVSEGGHGRV